MGTLIVPILAITALSACERGHSVPTSRPASESRLALVTKVKPDGTLRLRDARTGQQIRTLPNPCNGNYHEALSPAGDAVIVNCAGMAVRVPLDGTPTKEIGAASGVLKVSGDGRLVYVLLPDGRTPAFLRTDGTGSAPGPSGDVAAAHDGFVCIGGNPDPNFGPLSRTRYGRDHEMPTVSIPLAADTSPLQVIESTDPDAPLLIVHKRDDQLRLSRVASDGSIQDVASLGGPVTTGAVNARYVAYFDHGRERVYRIDLSAESTPVVVMDREAAALYPVAIDAQARLLVAADDNDRTSSTLVSIDVATGGRVGGYSIDASETSVGDLVPVP